MIDRRTCIGRLGVGILAIPFAAEAQQTGKKRPVVTVVTPSAFPRALTPELVRLGYVPGQHITIEYRQMTQAERLGPLMADLATRSDIIVAVGSPAVIAASQTTHTIPIVMIGIVDPLHHGFVTSLARPTANVTGVAWPATIEVTRTRLAFLKQIVPTTTEVTGISFGAYPRPAAFWKEFDATARGLGLLFTLIEVLRSEDLPGIFESLGQKRTAAALLLADAFSYDTEIIDRARQYRVPTAYAWRPSVEAGGLMAYGPAWDAMMRDAARYVAALLRGARVRDLPVEQPTTFELVINLKTAKALGLTIPQSLLTRADDLIQ